MKALPFVIIFSFFFFSFLLCAPRPKGSSLRLLPPLPYPLFERPIRWLDRTIGSSGRGKYRSLLIAQL